MRIFLILLLSSLLAGAQVPRWVIADFHDPRYSRALDGRVGVWSSRGRPALSPSFSNRLFLYQSDLVDEGGRRGLASLTHPRVGAYSSLDPLYLEYAVLSAKLAGIDAFLIEDSQTPALAAMKPIAARHGFHVFAAFNNKRAQAKADPASRLAAFRLAAPAFYAELEAPTWPRLDGAPLVFAWATSIPLFDAMAAFDQALSPRPLYYYWSLLTGRMEGENPVFQSLATLQEWRQRRVGFQPWIPPRLRPRDAAHPDWDHHATTADALAYLEHIRKEQAAEPGLYPYPMTVVTPGEDNRPCAGWGRTLHALGRDEGALLEGMWRFAVDHRDFFRIAFIATWNDYTESSGIEPTLERGLADLESTQRHARAFKGLPAVEPSLLALPERLHQFRLARETFRRCGLEAADFEALLDQAAGQLGRGEGAPALATLARAQSAKQALDASLPPLRTARLEAPGAGLEVVVHGSRRADAQSDQAWNTGDKLGLAVSEESCAAWRGAWHRAALSFEYLDEGEERFQVLCHSLRPDAESRVGGQYGIVADLYTTGTAVWKKARIEIPAENASWRHGLADHCDFSFAWKPVLVRRFRLDVEWRRGR
ncbi:MAG: hypothetical protein J0L75_03130 [Spirochaetes bacterium]|nr:hypothetical protein [Spirochaetota bacterium]